MPTRTIPLDKIEELLSVFESKIVYHEITNSYTLSEEGNFQLRLPWSKNRELKNTGLKYVICIIQTESASVGLIDNGQLVDHKTFSTYAVRKKQGKSQIKYLKTRGKSKAGSRLRLANTINFFEHINERLTTYFEGHSIEKIAFSCSKILIPYLYSSKVKCPFDKKDERIYKIPKHLQNANFEDLQMLHKYLEKGAFTFEENDTEQADLVLSKIFKKDE